MVTFSFAGQSIGSLKSAAFIRRLKRSNMVGGCVALADKHYNINYFHCIVRC